MAGLCEACSHVGAVLFAVEAGARMQEEVTCTGEKSKWLMPGYIKDIPYREVSEMDFTSAKMKDRLLREEQITPSATVNPPLYQRNARKAPAPSQAEKDEFFNNIAKLSPKSVILSLVQPHNANFVPKANQMLPKPFNELLHSPDYEKLTYLELVTKASEVMSTLSLTVEECNAIQTSTQDQSSSTIWFCQRAGKITASKLKDACHTDPDKPSPSLIKIVCYPEVHKFSTAATRWGCSNEKKARDVYQNVMNAEHENLTLADSGLHVNPVWPFLGASPDSMVDCDCCGRGVCEIKCPFKHRENTVLQATVLDEAFCLHQHNSKLALKKKHQYYYQVQAQLFVCDVDYCDFIVWTKKDVYIERIMPDAEFWEDCVRKASSFFIKGVLPEVMGKYFTRLSIASKEDEEDEEEGPWCYCQTEIDSTLIGCDNSDCQIEWYHMSCVNLTVEPDGEWFCPSCQNK